MLMKSLPLTSHPNLKDPSAIAAFESSGRSPSTFRESIASIQLVLSTKKRTTTTLERLQASGLFKSLDFSNSLAHQPKNFLSTLMKFLTKTNYSNFRFLHRKKVLSRLPTLRYLVPRQYTNKPRPTKEKFPAKWILESTTQCINLIQT